MMATMAMPCKTFAARRSPENAMSTVALAHWPWLFGF